MKAFTLYLPSGETLEVSEFGGKILVTGSQPLVLRPRDNHTLLVELEE